MGTIRVGVDVLAVAEVAESVRRFGDRYLRRIFTDHEIESCAGTPRFAAARLAARFCAKEATIKVLAPDALEAPPWRSIEVRRAGSGKCSLSLTGSAAELARDRGIGDLAVSLSHEHEVAAAVVVALAAAASPTTLDGR